MSRILVPIDGSGASHSALPYALRMARLYQSEIVLAGVAEKAYEDEPEPGKARMGLEEHLGKLREAFEKMGVPISVRAACGVPAEEIVQLAEQCAADLIVMSSHGRRGVGRWLLGGVTARVMREADCPVMITRPGEHQPGETHDASFRRILLPLDRSPLSERAMDAAAYLAERDQAHLCLLGVVDYPTWLCFQTEEKWAQRLPAVTEQYLSEQAEKLKKRGIRAYTQVCIGDPAEQILRLAESDVDLIVMATHGYSGIARAIMGSVAERVVHHARCPVLFVRQHQGAVASPPPAEQSPSPS